MAVAFAMGLEVERAETAALEAALPATDHVFIKVESPGGIERRKTVIPTAPSRGEPSGRPPCVPEEGNEVPFVPAA